VVSGTSPGWQASATVFTLAQAALFVAAVFVASASWQLILVSGGALIGRVADSREPAGTQPC
jgi:hypothetical protein